MRMKKTVTTLATAAAVGAAGLLGLSATPAAAAGVDFDYGRATNVAGIDAWKDSRMRGSVTWQIDAMSDGSKGDTLCVKDHYRDGVYVVATTGEGHRVSTKGHGSGYVKCMTRNVPEGMPITMRLSLHGANGTVTSSPMKIHG
ncbi:MULTISPECIES: hypothetical protein [unclassified Streptomyces]|uniref:hypothetical protein n=1 Tax=unclassified Streptomyces TaxID=2593676 RepID=UPI0036678599